MTDRTINWAEADRRGLNVVRRLDARVAPHRDGGVFFIEDLVAYDCGDIGWRRRQGTSLSGKSFTVKFDEEAKASATVAADRIVIAADLATDIIGDPRARIALSRLSGTGLFDSAEEIARAYTNMDAIVDEAMTVLGESAPPRPDELKSAYLSGTITVDGLVCAWKRLTEAREDQRRSQEMKVRKAEERTERLERDYRFLVEKAMEASMAAATSTPPREAMHLANNRSQEPERVLDAIHGALEVRPYLRHVLTQFGGFLRLWTSKDGLTWDEWGSFEKWERKRLIAERARATDAFGEDPMDHWGQVRGRLLERLKSNELDLLHREDVIARLAEARSNGALFVVIGNAGFIWDAETGEWHRREIERPDDARGDGAGSKIWLEGRIVSSNHGRIIVLPFIRQDGKKVDGHTRNAPYQGPSEPRSEPVEIPFEVYDDLNRDETWDPSGNIHVGPLPI